MKLTSLVCALPDSSSTGWGVASRRITEELGKIALVHDIRGSEFLKHDFPIDLNAPLIAAIEGVTLRPIYPQFQSPLAVGYSFAEDNILLRRYAINGPLYWDAIAVGSTWARETMKRALYGLTDMPVITAIQGVDADIFKPIERPDPDPSADKFTIWSAGKFEFRKAQDLVIRAVAVLMDRHSDVYLKAAWWNPWQQSMATMLQSKLIQFTGDMQAAARWYLDMERVEFIGGNEPHGESAQHIAMCDVGLFPSRCEAGTNLPLMEAMSCGLPVVATTEHGHADVTAHLPGEFMIPATKFIYERGNVPVGEWFEPSLDATVNALECAYQGWRSCSDTYCSQDKRNRAAMGRFTWPECAKNLLEAART